MSELYLLYSGLHISGHHMALPQYFFLLHKRIAIGQKIYFME